MRRVRHFLCAALACAGFCPAQTIVLDTFNAGAATGSVRTDTSWAGNVTHNAATITVGGTALNDNGWGATGLVVNATGSTFLNVTGQRDAGHAASVFVIQLEDASLNTHVLYVNASAFAVGTLTSVQIPLPTWTSGFAATNIASWSIGGGSVGSAAFHMTLDHLSFASAPTTGATFAPMGTATVGTALTGTSGLTLNGVGTLVLGTANSFSGAVTLDQGTLRLGAAGALPTGLATSIGTGTTLDLNGFAASIGPLSGSGAITLGAATLGVTQSTNSTFSGLISGTGSLTKSGTDALTLAGANTYGGGTTLSGGTLVASHSSSLGTGAVTLAAGADATLQLNSALSGLSLPNSITVAAGTGTATIGSTTGANFSTFAGTLTLNRPTTLHDGGSVGQRTTFDGVISGNVGTLTISGNRVTLGAANTFTGEVVVSNGATLQLTTNANQILPLTASVSTSTSGILQIVNHAAIGALSGGAGSILQVAPGGVPASTLTVGAKNIDSTFAGVIRNTSTGGGSGPFSLTKTGSGTLTLSGTNIYTGSTAINGGRLHLTGSTASSPFAVNSGGTLSGTGTVGALAINVGGTVSPGSSPGTLSAGATTFAGGGTLTWEINNATGVSGNNYDLLAISGGLTISATSGSPFTINLTSLTALNAPGLAENFNSASNHSFTFVTTTTGISNFNTNVFTLNTTGFTNPFNPGAWSIGQSGNHLTLNYAGASAIPEPSTYAALAGGAMLAFAAWRRHRKPARSYNTGVSGEPTAL